MDVVRKEARIWGGNEAHLGDGNSKDTRVRDLREISEKGRVRD